MKKYNLVLILCSLILSFVACAKPSVYQVTIDQGFGAGLSQTVYKVESGKTLNQSDLQGAPTLSSMLPTFKTADGVVFELGKTKVTSDLKLTIEWKSDTGLDCSSKSDAKNQLLNYAEKGDTVGIACSLNDGADVNQKGLNAATALLLAAKNNFLEAVKYLAAHGANVNDAISSSGLTALHFAVQNKSLEMVQYLVFHGGNVTAQDIINGGWTPLFYASYVGSVDILKYLLDHGANINDRDNIKLTILIAATQAGKLEMVKYLLENVKVDVNEKSSENWSALMYAANYCTTDANLEVIKYLANYEHVDLSLRDTTTGNNFSGKNALGIAIATKAARASNPTESKFLQDAIDYLTPLYKAAASKK